LRVGATSALAFWLPALAPKCRRPDHYKEPRHVQEILVALAAFFAFSAFAIDANTASQAELESIKGIGPAISQKIIDERGKGKFKDWNDMVDRVKGVGDKNAATFSQSGLTVNGSAFAGAPAKATPAKARKTPRRRPPPPPPRRRRSRRR